MPTDPLFELDHARYARHFTLPHVGVAGQRKLAAARVLLVGAGGLGSPAALYLAAAGVGTLGIVDGDVVELSNLQRQVLHDTPAIGTSKVASAASRIAALNPDVTVLPYPIRLDRNNARDVVREFDIVIDGSDNFPTRYLVNDACVLERVPFVYGSIFRFEGQLSLFAAPGGPCYRCLFAEPPAPELVPSCVEAGVLGVLPGVIGTLQALEAIKWILGAGTPAVGRLLLFDALSLRLREIEVAADPQCPACGEHPTISDTIDYDVFCGVKRDANDATALTAVELGNELRRSTPPIVIDVREQWELDIARLAGARHIPLHQLAARLDEVPRGVPLVTLCHHGVRSERARALLRGAGFANVRNATGGIDAWAIDVDPAMSRY